MTPAFVIGYDPGGNGRHGVAALQVRERKGRWIPVDLQVRTVDTLTDVVEWVEDQICRDVRIVAAGVDTLTEWNGGRSGWRPGDCWLKDAYGEVAAKIVASHSLSGSMAVNGAAFLTRLEPRFRADGTMVTEAHPKVAYFALTGRLAVLEKPSKGDGGVVGTRAWLRLGGDRGGC